MRVLRHPLETSFGQTKVSTEAKTAKRVVGYAMVVGNYACFTSECLTGTNLASALSLSPLQSVWDTYAPTLGLLTFLSFVPSAPILMSTYIFHIKSEINAQIETQSRFSRFLLPLEVLTTAIGQSFKEFIEQVSGSPFSLPLILADMMPSATHFYWELSRKPSASRLTITLAMAQLMKMVTT